MSTLENEAENLLKEAQKIMSTSSIIKFFKKTTEEEAIVCYERAGQKFKEAKNYLQAALAYRMAAEISTRKKDQLPDAGRYFILASKCFQKCDTANAIDCLLNAIKIEQDSGNFVRAARNYVTIAELYEKNLSDLQNASTYYEQAADYFKQEAVELQANKCLLKVAQFSAECRDYKKAAKIYQDIAFSDLRSSTLKHCSKEKFFKAILCYLCFDIDKAKTALNIYNENSPAFEISKESKCLAQIIHSLDNFDEQRFNKCLSDLDKFVALDDCCKRILLKIKRSPLRGYPDLC